MNPPRRQPARARVSRRYDLRFSGLVYVFSLVFIAVGAFNGQNNLLFVIFGLGVGGVIVSGVLSGSALTGLTLERTVTGPVHVGKPFDVVYRISNRNSIFPAFALLIEPERAHPRVHVPSVALAHSATQSSCRVRVRASASRRGDVRLGAVRVSSSFPFGLFRKVLVFHVDTRIVVRPAVVPIRDNIIARATVPGPTGTENPRRRGAGGEFYALRAYMRGDPPRLIAWKRSAAAGALLVRQHAAPAPPDVWVTIVHPGGPVQPWLAERAAALTRAVCVRLADRGCAVGLRADWIGVLFPPTHGGRVTALADETLPRLDFDARLRQARRIGLRREVRVGLAPGDGDVHADRPQTWLPADAQLPPALLPKHTVRPDQSLEQEAV